MKKFVCAILFILAIKASAQTPIEQQAWAISVGNNVQYQQIIHDCYGTILRQLNGTYFAVIGGKVYDMRLVGQPVHGKVIQLENGVYVITQAGGAISDIAVTNYNGVVTYGRDLSVCAMKTGVYNYLGTQPLELWDCGKPYIPPPPTPDEIAAAKAKQVLAAKLAAARDYQSQSNAVLHLQVTATNGEAWAQGSLGWHYLNGLGCETNREFGIYWLKKATDQGDLEASNNLARLKL